MISHPPPFRRPVGFTLVEILIVVTLIGLLAALALPAMERVRMTSRVAVMLNELRTIAQICEQYALENGDWPPDGINRLHPILIEYGKTDFGLHTSLGGQWDWDRGQGDPPVNAALGVYVGGAANGAQLRRMMRTVMQRVDQQLDDGDLETGFFRSRNAGYMLILEH